jgi:hypothetical protein
MSVMDKQYVLDIYNILKENIKVSYTGPFDGQVLTTIGSNIQHAIRNYPQVSKRIFRIFIELAQNISYYSAEKIIGPEGFKSGVGILLIKEFQDYFTFFTGNMVSKESEKIVKEKCETIRNLNREGLREFKREKRGLPQGEHGAGNIGLIQVALLSDDPIQYKVSPVDENTSFFILAVNIGKEIDS